MQAILKFYLTILFTETRLVHQLRNWFPAETVFSRTMLKAPCHKAESVTMFQAEINVQDFSWSGTT